MSTMQVNLDYFTQRHCSTQWRLFVSELVREFHTQVDRDLASGFFRQVGRRMAAALPLGPCDTLEAVEQALNRVLGDMDWGWVRVREGERALELTHGAYPVVPIGEHGIDAWLVPLLEGAYTEWLTGLGGDPAFTAQCYEMPRAPVEAIRLRYGRPPDAAAG